MGGGGVVVTVMVARHVAVPPAPVTVAVYVVVCAGETTRDPDATGVTAPMPWLIEIEVALLVVHDKVEELPV